MRNFIKLSVLLTLIGLCDQVRGQESLDKLHDFEMEYTSGQVLEGIKNDLNEKYPVALSQIRQRELDRFNGAQQNEFVPVYFESFEKALKATKTRFYRQEVLAKSGAELLKYGLDVAGNYAQDLPFKHLANFTMPAIQRGMELYVDKEISDLMMENRTTLDNLIVKRINLLFSNGIDVVTTENDFQSFQNLFAFAQADLPSLDREDFPVVNNELIKYAYQFIEKNRESIALIDYNVTAQYEAFREEFDAKLESFNEKIKVSADARFNEIGASIAALTENQFEVLETLGKIEARVKGNEEKIAAIEQQMILVKDNVTELTKLQKQHSILLSKNSFQLSILTKYAFQNLSTEQKIKGLEAGHFNQIFTATEKATLKAELLEIQEKETIISVANSISAYTGKTYEFLVQNGILKGEDARNAGKLVHAIQVGTGIARMYAGDASGALSVLSGLGGLFGSKPKKSAEMQMLERMLKVMNARFDRIEEKLEIIEGRVVHLTDITIKMYRSMMNSFQVLNDQLEWNTWQNGVLRITTSTGLYSRYNNCEPVKTAFDELELAYNGFKDYKRFYNENTGICLSALNNYSIHENNFGYFHMASMSPLLGSGQLADYEIRSLYEPVRDFFMMHYNNNLNLALNALMFPVREIRYTYQPLLILKNKVLQPVNVENATYNYFNYEMINQFADLFLTFSQYFEIADPAGRNYFPLELDTYLAQSKEQRGLLNSLLRQRIENLLTLTDYAIMQQSLLAGNTLMDPIYAVLFTANQSQAERLKVFDILSKNKLLATNFAANLIRKNLTSSGLDRYAALNVDFSSNLAEINKLIVLKNFTFVIETDGKIMLDLATGQHKLQIPLPNATAVLTNEMKNTGALYALMETRKRLHHELIDLTFTANLDREGITQNEFKYMFMEPQPFVLIEQN